MCCFYCLSYGRDGELYYNSYEIINCYKILSKFIQNNHLNSSFIYRHTKSMSKKTLMLFVFYCLELIIFINDETEVITINAVSVITSSGIMYAPLYNKE